MDRFGLELLTLGGRGHDEGRLSEDLIFPENARSCESDVVGILVPVIVDDRKVDRFEALGVRREADDERPGHARLDRDGRRLERRLGLRDDLEMVPVRAVDDDDGIAVEQDILLAQVPDGEGLVPIFADIELAIVPVPAVRGLEDLDLRRVVPVKVDHVIGFVDVVRGDVGDRDLKRFVQVTLYPEK